jgi:hypothetical protein
MLAWEHLLEQKESYDVVEQIVSSNAFPSHITAILDRRRDPLTESFTLER